jgi:hypothetical protein
VTTEKPIRYSEGVRPEDTKEAMKTVTAALFPNEAKPYAVNFGGKCPRCKHETASRKWLFGVAAALKVNEKQMEDLAKALEQSGSEASSGDETFDLTCACTADHPMRPADKLGCGARFRVRVTWP